jgi:hypothetical protein
VKRNRTMAIAVAMALALTAFIGVASASANYFKSQVAPQTWNGTRAGASHALRLGETGLFKCENVSFSGQEIVLKAEELTVSPELNKCSHQAGAPTGWSMRGCKLRFHAGAGPALLGSVDIVGCEPSMLYENQLICRTEIGNQSNVGTAEYKNTTSGGLPAVTIVAKLYGITYTREKGAICGETSGSFKDGEYEGEWTVTGTKGAGEHVGVEVESTPEPPPPPPSKFATEQAPATLSGSTTSKLALSFNQNAALYCETTTLSGTMSSLTAATIALVPKYHNCYVYAFPSGGQEEIKVPDEYITPGGCSYEFGAKGEFNVVGATCASKPLTLTIPSCVITVGPQSGLSNKLVLKNEGTGQSRVVSSLGSSGTPMTYTATGAGCVSAGTFTTGLYRGSAKYSAKNSKGEAQGLWIE